jgi:hypothetical protein
MIQGQRQVPADGLHGPAGPARSLRTLWRQAQLTAKQGLYEVADGIYQVRGFDTSNMTMVESRSPPAAGPAKPQPNAASDARQVETPVARSLVAGDVHDGAVIKVGLDNGELPISYDKPA